MKNIFKYKKLIAFSLLFLLSFYTITDYKQKEANAIVGVDDAILILLGVLVAGTGIAIINDSQAKHMGSRVWEHIKETTGYLGNDIKEGVKIVKDKVGREYLIIDKLIKDSIISTSNTLPNVKGFNKISVGDVSSYSFYSNSYPQTGMFGNFTKDINAIGEFKGAFEFIGNVDVFINDTFNHTIKMGYDFSTSVGLIYIHTFTNSNGYKTIGYSILDSTRGYRCSLGKNFTSSATNDKITFKGSTGIYEEVDYSNSKIRENYNPTVVNTNIPWTKGIDELENGDVVGTIPINAPVIDRVINGDITNDIPITWDDVKTSVGEKVIDGDIVKDRTDVIDDTTDITVPEELSLWGWLKNLLKSIWDILKGILDFLLNFLKALLNGIKDLLLSLLVPSSTFFTDSFNDLKLSFGNRLNIDSYTRLFNSDYGSSEIKDITVNFYGQTVTIVRFSMYEKFRSVINTLIYAFMFFLLAIYNYSQVYKLIRGSDYVGASSTITHMGGGLTNSDMSKIFNNERERIKIGEK